MPEKCLICSNDLANAPKLPGLLKCGQCNFITADLEVSDEKLKALYSHDYFHGLEYGNYTRDEKIIRKNFNRRLKTLDKYIDPKSCRLFEIGCAYGFFLNAAKESYSSVSGIDISEDATAYAREKLHVQAKSGDFLKEEKHNQPYDLFCLWDTIEHLNRPDLFIKKISNEINNNGFIAITTADIGSLNAKIKGKKWRQIHPPTHLHYFSFQTLKLLLEKNNFTIIHKSYPGNLMSLDTIFYILMCLKSDHKNVYNFFKKTGLLNIVLYVNLFDTMFVIAQKNLDIPDYRS